MTREEAFDLMRRASVRLREGSDRLEEWVSRDTRRASERSVGSAESPENAALAAAAMADLACELDHAILREKHWEEEAAPEISDSDWCIYRNPGGATGLELRTPIGCYRVSEALEGDGQNSPCRPSRIWQAVFLPASRLAQRIAAGLRWMLPEGFGTAAAAKSACLAHSQQLARKIANAQNTGGSRKHCPSRETTPENIDLIADKIIASFDQRLFDAGYTVLDDDGGRSQDIVSIRRMLRRSIKAGLAEHLASPASAHEPSLSNSDEMSAFTSAQSQIEVFPQENCVRLSLEPIKDSGAQERFAADDLDDEYPLDEPIYIDLSPESALDLIERIAASLDAVTARYGSFAIIGNTLLRLLAVAERFGDHRASR